MKTYTSLSDFLKAYGTDGEKDCRVVLEWIKANELEGWALAAIPELAKQSVEKLQWSAQYADSWATCMQNKAIIDRYGWDDGEMLNNWALFVCMHSRPPRTFGEHWAVLDEETPIPERSLERLRDRIPKLNKPQIYFRPAIVSLHNLGIFFKDEDPATATED